MIERSSVFRLKAVETNRYCLLVENQNFARYWYPNVFQDSRFLVFVSGCSEKSRQNHHVCCKSQIDRGFPLWCRSQWLHHWRLRWSLQWYSKSVPTLWDENRSEKEVYLFLNKSSRFVKKVARNLILKQNNQNYVKTNKCVSLFLTFYFVWSKILKYVNSEKRCKIDD